ncbi:MAG: LuxR family transcriptional regulator [Acidimicrobiia bacterium]|nr:LuxR family transcriptional regulator [Acidimicrobiia bacterium]
MTVAALGSRVRNDLVRLVHRDFDFPQVTAAVGRRLGKAVPFEGICLLTVDPATLLPTADFVENGLPPAATTRLTEIELREQDVNKFTTLAHAPVPAASLSAATAGDLDRSRRHRELRRPNGFGDELRAVLTSPAGTWGALTLNRESTSRDFTPTEVRFVASLAPILAEGVRRIMLRTNTVKSDDARVDTGFLVIADDDSIEVANDAAEQWIAQLTANAGASASLPVAIRAVVAQTRAAAATGGAVATVRVQTRTGVWLMVRGSLIGADRIGVLLEPARPAELATVIGDTYGLTERERVITGVLAHGLPTTEIADRLHLSAYTVQDHLKAIFEKTGTGSRGELVARIFLDHHLPHLLETTEHVDSTAPSTDHG